MGIGKDINKYIVSTDKYRMNIGRERNGEEGIRSEEEERIEEGRETGEEEKKRRV